MFKNGYSRTEEDTKKATEMSGDREHLAEVHDRRGCMCVYIDRNKQKYLFQSSKTRSYPTKFSERTGETQNIIRLLVTE